MDRLLPSQLAATLDVTPYSKLKHLHKIGEGGFGHVYHAIHQDWSEVAYKKLMVNFIKPDERAAHELKGEVAVHIHLRHPNVITLMGVVFEPKHYGVILEFAPHGDLRHFLEKFKPVHWAWKLNIVYEVSLGMNYLHTARERPVIHGDLKVKNILVGHGYRAKISDFGLSRWKQFSYDVSGRSSEGGGGTVTHIPPESWNDINLARTEKVDVYAFGVMLWEMFSERRPWIKVSVTKIKDDVVAGKRPALRLILEDVPDYVKEMISECWAQLPDDRPLFSALKDKLDRWCRQLGDYIHAAERTLQIKEYANQGGGNAAAAPPIPRAPAAQNVVSRPRTGPAPTQAQDNSGPVSHTAEEVHDPGSTPAQVEDRSGVHSRSSIDIQAQRRQELMSSANSHTYSSTDSFVTATSSPVAVSDESSRSITALQQQAVDLHISDDQRPPAGPQTDIQPMDTAEVHHQPPRGEDDPEVAGMPMDAAGNDDFQRYGETHQ